MKPCGSSSNCCNTNARRWARWRRDHDEAGEADEGRSEVRDVEEALDRGRGGPGDHEPPGHDPVYQDRNDVTRDAGGHVRAADELLVRVSHRAAARARSGPP